jgi:hypothetical protein
LGDGVEKTVVANTAGARLSKSQILWAGVWITVVAGLAIHVMSFGLQGGIAPALQGHGVSQR